MVTSPRSLARPMLAAFICSLSIMSAASAFALSFSLDFDGVGSGASFSIDVRRPSFHREGNGRSDRFDDFLETRAGQQAEEARARAEAARREAERKAEEERVRAQLEKARRLHNVENLQKLLDRLETLNNDEPNLRKRMREAEQVQVLATRYEQAKREYLATLPSYRERLSWSMDHIHVPPPLHPRHYRRILFWGLGTSPDQARVAALQGERDPFNGKRFDDVFAFGDSDVVSDAPRVVQDHLLSIFGDRLSRDTTRQMRDLTNAEADEVVCHSNGCRIAETLIATGKLKASRLRILGGDNALVELDYLKQLKERRHLKEISVFVVHGDQVPILDAAGWKIMQLMHDLGHPLQSFRDKAGDPVYRILGLAGKPGFDPRDPVQVHVLSYPGAADSIEKHLYDTYRRVITGWTRNGLMKDGAMNPKYMIH